VSRVLLLSDGLANRGETDPAALAQHARDLRAQGIATSTFGLGADFDETLMSRLATDGGGHFYFIEQPAQIPDFFTSELDETLDVVARDARLIIRGGAGIDVGCLNEFTVEHGSGGPDVHIRLGDLVSDQQVTVVVAIRSTAGDAGGQIAISARLADRDHALFAQPLAIDWRVVDEAADAAQPINADVLIQVATLAAERARTDALDANRRGDYATAARILTTAAAALRALAPDIRPIDALAAELESERDEFAAAMSPARLKERHFASYSVAHSRDTSGRARRRAAASAART
jgi:Ca-activated chloride channel family protein